MADKRDWLEPDEPHDPDDMRSSLSDEHGLEPHLNGVHGYRLNDLMWMGHHVQEQLHRDAHQREVRVAEADTVATLLTERAELRAEVERLRELAVQMEHMVDAAERLCARCGDLLERRSRRVDL